MIPNFVIITSNIKDCTKQIGLRLKKYGARVILFAPKPIVKDDIYDAFDGFYEVENIHSIYDLSVAIEWAVNSYGEVKNIICHDTDLTEICAKIRTKYNILGIDENLYDKVCTKIGVKHLFAENGLPILKICDLDDYEKALSFIKLNGTVMVLPKRQEKRAFSKFIENEEDLKDFFNECKNPADYIIDMCTSGKPYMVSGIFRNHNDIIHKQVFKIEATLRGVKENPLNFTIKTENDNDDSRILVKMATKILKVCGILNGFFNFVFIKLDKDVLGVGFKDDFIPINILFLPISDFIWDMMNYAYDIDCYDYYARVLLDQKIENINLENSFCVAYLSDYTVVNKDKLKDILFNAYAKEIVRYRDKSYFEMIPTDIKNYIVRSKDSTIINEIVDLTKKI